MVLGTAASSLAAWGLRDSNGAAAASFGVSAGALVGIFAYTMKAIMPINRRLLPEGRVEEKESEEGIRALLQQASRLFARRGWGGGGRECTYQGRAGRAGAAGQLST